MKNISKKLIVTVALLVLPVLASAKPYEGKKVLFIDSYHQGYA